MYERMNMNISYVIVSSWSLISVNCECAVFRLKYTHRLRLLRLYFLEMLFLLSPNRLYIPFHQKQLQMTLTGSGFPRVIENCQEKKLDHISRIYSSYQICSLDKLTTNNSRHFPLSNILSIRSSER